MNFTFEFDNDMQFGFENTISQSDNAPKFLAGDAVLQLDGTDVYAAGTTVLIEEEETT